MSLSDRANLASLTALRKCFASVAFCEDGGFLGVEELAEVLKSPKRDDLFIGGFADDASRTVTFWRGNLHSMTVPFSAFESSGDGVSPDMSKLTVTDCGQTVQFGDYEASVDAILYEHDSDYRRKVRENLLKRDSSFGGKRYNTMNYMWRTFRVLIGSLFYLLASLVLIISLKCYPKDIRQQAKDNFI